MKMIITDLDGTLIRKDGSLSSSNRRTLQQLGAEGVVRVVATGRSVFSAYKVLENDFPIDYLIFSTGAGILDWEKKRVIYKKHLGMEIVSELVSLLYGNNIGFMLHKEIPDNHQFYYHNGSYQSQDYEDRLLIYGKFASTFVPEQHTSIIATQIICICPDSKVYELILSLIREYRQVLSCIRATSPLDGKSIWLEIFPQGVNKSSAAQHLASSYGIKARDVMVIGNDWNDEDLLEWGGESYVVANAPDALKNNHINVASNEADGFSEAVSHCFLRHRLPHI